MAEQLLLASSGGLWIGLSGRDEIVMRRLSWNDDNANRRLRGRLRGVRYDDDRLVRTLRERLGEVWHDDRHIFVLVSFCSGHDK